MKAIGWGYSKKKQQAYPRFPQKPKLSTVVGSVKPSSGRIHLSTKTKTFEPVYVSEHYWGLELASPTKAKLRLGNWTDAGWHWSGEEDSMADYMVRLARSQIDDVDEILKTKGITIDALKPLAMKSMSDSESIYSITGDNGRWHFGEEEPDSEYQFDQFFEITDRAYKQSEREEIMSKTWNLYDAPNYDSFNEDYGDKFRKLLKEAIKNAKSFDDLKELTEPIKEEADSLYSEEIEERFEDAIGKAEKQLLEEGTITGRKIDPNQTKLDEGT